MECFGYLAPLNTENLFIKGATKLLMQLNGRVNSEKEKGTASMRAIEERFFTTCSPSISLEEYIVRVYESTSKESNYYLFIYSIILIERFNSFSVVWSSNISLHRLIITAFTIVNKMYTDTFYTNTYYAILGGISVKELNEHEQDFLQVINWHVIIHKSDVEDVTKRLALFVNL